MKATHVSLAPTRAAREAGRPALTPELLAASGARYSRNNEGLEAILSKIDPDDPDKSVDGIFRMLDYGHASIADMSPVAIFIDGVSLFLAALVWNLCPTAAGQESSTRYIDYKSAQALDASFLGIAEEDAAAWREQVEQSFGAYERASQAWAQVAERFPDRTRIPQSLRDDPAKARAVERMERNFAFDRARVFLPACASTNMMLLQSARAWASLCANLSSLPLPEAHELARCIREELALAAPRLLRHAEAKEGLRAGWQNEIERWSRLANKPCKYLHPHTEEWTHPTQPFLQVLASENLDAHSDLEFHDNRYGWFGDGLRRTLVRFGWQAVALAEVRDLNRHRTGTRFWPPVPVGFYDARDEWPHEMPDAIAHDARDVGAKSSRVSREKLARGEASGVYWGLLGSQFFFEHSTTADKFLYEAELRTGVGAHYRYAAHLHESLALWYEQFPQTKGLVLEGSAEPE